MTVISPRATASRLSIAASDGDHHSGASTAAVAIRDRRGFSRVDSGAGIAATDRRLCRARERYRLIAGRHRLEAIRQLGRDAIYARIVSGIDAAAAELMEIDENLIRAELSPAEHALHIGRQQATAGAAPGDETGWCTRESRRRQKAKPAEVATFAKDTATKAGKNRRALRRDPRDHARRRSMLYHDR